MSLDLLDVDFSAITDATGAATIPLKLSKAFYAVANVVGQVTGKTAQWSVLVNQRLWKPGRGSTADMGPILIQPTDAVVVTVAGAIPAAQVTGKLAGLTATTLQEALQHYSPAPNLVALDTAAPVIRLGNVRVAANGTLSQSFPLPPGALAIGYLVDSLGAVASPTQVQVSGDQTLDNYLTDFNPTGLHGAMLAGVDTSVTLQVIAGVSTAANVYLFVWTSQAVVALNPFIEQSPLPWQAPTAIADITPTSVASGAVLNIIPAIAGKTVRLFNYSFAQDASNAAAQWQLQDTGGTEVASYFDVAARHVFASGSFGGAPLTSGLGLQIKNSGAAGSFVGGFVAYSYA